MLIALLIEQPPVVHGPQERLGRLPCCAGVNRRALVEEELAALWLAKMRGRGDQQQAMFDERTVTDADDRARPEPWIQSPLRRCMCG